MTFRPVKPRDYGTVKDVVSRLVADAGGAKRAAHVLGLSATQVYAYTDPAEPARISLDDAWRLSLAARSLTLVEAIAADVGAVTYRVDRADEAFSIWLAKGEKANGDLMALIAARIDLHAHGKLSAGDLAALKRDLDGAIQGLAAARAYLCDAGEGS